MLTLPKIQPYHRLFSPPPPTPNFTRHPLSSLNNVLTSSKTKNKQKLEPFVKAAVRLSEGEWEQNDVKDPLLHLNANSFWYLISAQYFQDCHLPSNKRKAFFKEIAQNIRDYVNQVSLKRRLERRSKPFMNQYLSLDDWRTEELKMKADSVAIWVKYFFYLQSPIPHKVVHANESQVQRLEEITTPLEDLAFVNSTVTMLCEILNSKMQEEGPFKTVVKFHLDNVELNSKTVLVRKSNPVSLEEKPQQEEKEQFQEVTLTSEHILRSIILDLPLEDVIGLLEQAIPNNTLPTVPFFGQSLWADPEDPANFVGTHLPEEDQYIKMAKAKARQPKPKVEEQASKSRKKKTQKEEDLQCQICFSGQYQDSNLILLCSLCNIAMHQYCVYLQQIPKDNWICSVCATFGPKGANLPCPLCPNRGGAMIESPLRTKDFLSLSNHYSKYKAKSTPAHEQAKYVTPQMLTRSDLSLSYNYFKPETYWKAEPKCYRVWAHHACISVHNECYFSKQGEAIVAEGIKNVASEKYGKICEICGMGDGAAAPCREPGCGKYFHGECARRSQMVFQEESRDTVIYKVFCQSHKPFELQMKVLESRRKAREDIKKLSLKISKCLAASKSPAVREPKIIKRQIEEVVPSTPKKKKFLNLDEVPELATVPSPTKKTQPLEAHQQYFDSILQRLKKYVYETFGELATKDKLNKIIASENQFWQQISRPEQGGGHQQKFTSLLQAYPSFQAKLRRLRYSIETSSTVKVKIQENVEKQLQRTGKSSPSSKSKGKESKKEMMRQRSKSKKAAQNLVKIEDLPVRVIKKPKKKELKVKIEENGPAEKLKEEEDEFIQEEAANKEKEKEIRALRSKKKIIVKKQVAPLPHKKEKKNNTAKPIVENLTANDDVQLLQREPKKIEKQVRLRRGTASEKQKILYCVCRKPYDYSNNEDMMACDKCDEWFHPSCIGFKKSISKAKQIEFVCESCLGILTKKEKADLFQKYQNYFLPTASILTHLAIKREQRSRSQAKKKESVPKVKLEEDIVKMSMGSEGRKSRGAKTFETVVKVEESDGLLRVSGPIKVEQDE